VNSDHQQIPHWPATWPGNTVVDLDNLGDPGFWIEEHIPNPADVLFGDPDSDDDVANELSYAYIEAASELTFPLPSDFDATEEETFEIVKNDFLGFIREWRKRANARKQV
jgi:hypothetical protein